MADTVLGSAGTTATATLDASLYGRVDSEGDHDWYRVNLVAGQTYEFRLHGVGIDELFDPEVRVRDASGNQLAINDDAGTTRWDGGNRYDSYLEFTASATGSYYIDVNGHGEDETGDFLLTAARHGSRMIFTPDEIAWQTTNNYQSWQNGGRSARWAPTSGNTVTVNLTGLTSAGAAMADNALKTWSEITGLNFVQTSGTADITFDDNASGNSAQTFYNVDSTGHRITNASVQISTGWLATYGTGFKSYSYETYLHEIGHALGLGHGGDYDGSATYAADAYYQNDSVAYSIMSYMNAFGDEFDQPGNNAMVNPNENANFRYMLTYASADVLAIQDLYHFTPTVRAGDTTYGWNSNTGNAGMDAAVTVGSDMFMTIVDSGGNDTLNFSLTSANQNIYLDAETGSDVLGGDENLWIARGSVIENATGGSGIDVIVGNSADNRIDGGGGADEMWGGAGDDTFRVDDIHDDVEEFAGQGAHDRVNTTLTSYTLLGDVEELNYIGPTYTSFTGNGNGLDNLIIGWAGNDVLDGKAGADTMQGLSGDDLYWVDNIGDVVVESASGGTQDRVNTTLTHYTLGANVEILDYEGPSGLAFTGTGNELDNTIQGFGGNDVLDGKGGADLMRGYAGDDIYFVDNANDTLTEIAGAGNDSVFASVSYTLAAGVSIELLRGNAGATGLTLTGNEIANRIVGLGGADTLDGKGGADRMEGGGGDDFYWVDSSGDLVVELAGAGAADRINTTLQSYTLPVNVEILDYEGDSELGFSGKGNALANIIQGYNGADTLDGKGGADILRGYDGDDVYFVDVAGDTISESAGFGYDSVYASSAYTLGAGVSVELLRANAGGTGLTLTGNELANKLVGSTGVDTLNGAGGADILNGVGGADVMSGGAGDDVYYVDVAGDVVKEATGGGKDTVWASVSYTLGAGQEVEFLRAAVGGALTLTGNELVNTIIGGSGAERIAGGGGADFLTGGSGADVFVYASLSDSTNALADLILDFATGADKIDLSSIDANTATATNDAFSLIAGGFTHHAGELRQQTGNGNTYVYGDVNGDGGADLKIALKGEFTLGGGNFVV